MGRICAVADGVVSCRFLDVFGKRLVTLQGEGLIAKSERSDKEESTEDSYVPPVVRYVTSKKFEVNPSYLEGLVGFETGKVYRPGLSLHLFQENDRIHGRYNRELETALQGAFATEPMLPLAKVYATQEKGESINPRIRHLLGSRVSVSPSSPRHR